MRAQSAQTSDAECRDLDSLKMVASIIVHEEWHLTHGRDEEGAYYAQLMALQLLGFGIDSVPYQSVKRVMRGVLAAQRARARDQVTRAGVSKPTQ